jgi:hypothetical protein
MHQIHVKYLSPKVLSSVEKKHDEILLLKLLHFDIHVILKMLAFHEWNCKVIYS